MAPSWPATIGLDLAMQAAWRGADPAALAVPTAEVATIVGRYSLLVLDPRPARAVTLADSFAAVAAGPDRSPGERIEALLRRHVYQLARGRYQAAWELLRQASLLDPAGTEVLGATVVHQLVTGTHDSEADDAAQRLLQLGAARPLWATVLLAWRSAATATPDSAVAAVNRLLASGEYPAFRAALVEGLTGLVALRAGDSIAARRGLARGNASWIETRDIEEFFPTPYLALVLSDLDRRAGDFAVAAQRLSETVGPIGILFRARAEEDRGQIAVQRGDTAAAIRAYRNFIDLWTNAGPELQPRVTAARAALARLER
jgi:tetratricopeptide (TPR) repeat protein